MSSETVSPTWMAKDGGGSPSSPPTPKSAFGRLCRKLSPLPPPPPPRNNKLSASASKQLLEKPSPAAFAVPSDDIFQRVFEYFDENGDGKISPQELQSCVRTIGGDLSGDEAEAAIMYSDTDGDGLLGLEDFRRLMEGDGGSGSSSSLADDKEELRQAFGMYETKPGSGCISPSSLKRMLSRLGEPRSIDDCKAMIRPFDLNGDGVLSFPEFALMMR